MDHPRGTRRPDLLDQLGFLVESRWVRIGLVVLIILSVLPYRDVERELRPLFLAAFGLELSVRAALLAGSTSWATATGSPRPSQVASLHNVSSAKFHGENGAALRFPAWRPPRRRRGCDRDAARYVIAEQAAARLST